MPNNKNLRVISPARLHFGQIDLNGSYSRIYGGVGLGISEPNVVLTGQRFSRVRAEGPKASRVEEIAQKFIHQLKRKSLIAKTEEDIGIYVRVEETIPAHVGLGSSTQLALSVGSLINKLYELDLSIRELAVLVDRKNSRSGIGYAVFTDGGFVVDGGRPRSRRYDENYLPPVLFQKPLPESWRFLLVLPKTDSRGLSGAEEKQAFQELPPMPDETAADNSRRILLQMMPAVLEDRPEIFGQSLLKVQKNVGDYFQDYQEGRFATAVSAEIIEEMLTEGAAGAGQSSWGPLLYGLCSRQQQAEYIKLHLEHKFGNKLDYIAVVEANNTGVSFQKNC